MLSRKIYFDRFYRVLSLLEESAHMPAEGRQRVRNPLLVLPAIDGVRGQTVQGQALTVTFVRKWGIYTG